MSASQSFEIDGVKFTLDPRPGKQRGKSTSNNFVLVKSPRLLDFYKNWRFEKPKTIMEIGLFEGGSLVLLDKLFKPERLVGLDIRREPIEALEEYAAKHDHIKTFYGRSQDKPGTLSAARSSFAGGIDLVIDDASHLYDQTKATFESLFPLVSRGGNYVIEDWAWSHRKGMQAEGATWADRPAMTNLVFELVVMAGVHGAVEEVLVHPDVVVIRRGRGRFPDNSFDLSEVLRNREMMKI